MGIKIRSLITKGLSCVLFAVMLFNLCACGKTPQSGTSSSSKVNSGGSSETVPPVQSSNVDKTNKATEPERSCAAYLSLVNPVLENIMGKVKTNPQTIESEYDILPILNCWDKLVSLSACFMPQAQAEGKLAELGFTNAIYNRSGNSCTISYVDTNGIPQEVEAKYDITSDSLSFTIFEQDKLMLMLEYTKSPNGYHAQYYSIRNDGSDYVKWQLLIDGDTCIIGLTEHEFNIPYSIFKKLPYKASDSYYEVFPTATKFYISRQGLITAIVNESEYNFDK